MLSLPFSPHCASASCPVCCAPIYSYITPSVALLNTPVFRLLFRVILSACLLCSSLFCYPSIHLHRLSPLFLVYPLSRCRGILSSTDVTLIPFFNSIFMDNLSPFLIYVTFYLVLVSCVYCFCVSWLVSLTCVAHRLFSFFLSLFLCTYFPFYSSVDASMYVDCCLPFTPLVVLNLPSRVPLWWAS